MLGGSGSTQGVAAGRGRAARALALLVAGAAVAAASAPIAERPALADPPATRLASSARVAQEPATSAALAPKEEAQPPEARCPGDVVEVEGEYCPYVEQRCVRWMPPTKYAPPRCARFAPSKCVARTVRKHFCIDRYEYPNKRGERPAVMKSFNQAQAICAKRGKRLCGDTEWTLACEGRERLPYPYGLERDSDACNIDKPRIDVNGKALRDTRTRAAELERLWQGEESGARAACASQYGVFDMTGNVDEWVVNEKGEPFKGGLKGGYWGPVRDACRPMTTAHGEDFNYYQTGFRCCADPAPTPAPSGKQAGQPATRTRGAR